MPDLPTSITELQVEVLALREALRCPSTDVVCVDGEDAEVRCELQRGHDGEHSGTAVVEYPATWTDSDDFLTEVETERDAALADAKEAWRKAAKLRRMVDGLSAGGMVASSADGDVVAMPLKEADDA